MLLSPRAVGRGQFWVPDRSRSGIAIVAFVLALVPAIASASPHRHRRSIVSIDVGYGLLGVPTTRWQLEQQSYSIGASVSPQSWIVLRSAIEASTTEIQARRLPADPFQVRTKLDARRSWGFAHSLSVRTHRFGPARLEMFGDVRWMPGTSALRILQLVLDPGAWDLALFGRLDDLARARFSWWQAAAGARFGVRAGPLDAWLDAGALWVRLGLRYALREQALALARMAAPDGQIDSEGTFTIREGQPFARAGLRLDLPGPFTLTGTGTAVPTRHGLSHGLTLGASVQL